MFPTIAHLDTGNRATVSYIPMATMYERKGSPYLWIKSKIGGVVKQESTGLRKSDPGQRRKAQLLLLRTKTVEQEALGQSATLGKGNGWGWVVPFLKQKYSTDYAPGTLVMYLQAWSTISLFLEENEIENPRQFEYKHFQEFSDWRMKRAAELGRRIGRNKIVADMRFLTSVVLKRAVKEGLIGVSPKLEDALPTDEVKERPALTPEDDAIIRKAIAEEPNAIRRHMLRVSFEVARYQGCRLAETRFNLQTDVDSRNPDSSKWTITFHAKRKKVFTTSLHPVLVPLIKALREQKRVWSWDVAPAFRCLPARWAAFRWHKFLSGLQKKGLVTPGVTFHSTRVTVVTELARAGVSLSKAMRFVGHANSVVHSIYQRLNAQDVAGCTAVIGGVRPASGHVCPTCGQSVPDHLDNSHSSSTPGSHP